MSGVASETNLARQFDFAKMSFNGTLERTLDSTRPGNAITLYEDLSNPDRLRDIAFKSRAGIIPSTKMYFYPLHLLDREKTKSLIVSTFSSLLDRYGRNFLLRTSGIDVSVPPYYGIFLPVLRVITSTFLQMCAPDKKGQGGSENYYCDVMISDGRGANNIKDIQEAVSRDYREYAKSHPYGDCSEAPQRASSVILPWVEKLQETVLKEDRNKSVVVTWLNVWKKRDTPVPETLTRDLKLEHFASFSPFPDTYEQSRDPTHKNCVVEFEKWFNQRLIELNKQGWKITHYNLSVKPRMPVPGDPQQLPQNQFYAQIQCERDENNIWKAEDPEVKAGKEEEGTAKVRPPLKQIRAVADKDKLSRVLPNRETHQFMAEPFNRLATDENEPLKDWNAGVITWGHFATDTVPYVGPREVHTIMLTEPAPDDGPGESKLKNLRFHSTIFRGPHSTVDPSQIPPTITNDLAEQRITILEEAKTGPELLNKVYLLYENWDQVKEAQKQAIEKLRHFIEDRLTHEWEWMMDGAIMYALSLLRGEFKGIVTGRDYLDQNFPGGVQGFNGRIFLVEDISRAPVYAMDP